MELVTKDRSTDVYRTKRNSNRKYFIEDYVGKVFNGLTVLGRLPKSTETSVGLSMHLRQNYHDNTNSTINKRHKDLWVLIHQYIKTQTIPSMGSNDATLHKRKSSKL